mmetsp:Transcript_14691/g.44863  ORF Transcript_14691/g.44863 Transcript_14691/m.44863 type:complete len:221 (+) Transcript_14691:843-1505(+)
MLVSRFYRFRRRGPAVYCGAHTLGAINRPPAVAVCLRRRPLRAATLPGARTHGPNLRFCCCRCGYRVLVLVTINVRIVVGQHWLKCLLRLNVHRKSLHLTLHGRSFGIGGDRDLAILVNLARLLAHLIGWLSRRRGLHLRRLPRHTGSLVWPLICSRLALQHLYGRKLAVECALELARVLVDQVARWVEFHRIVEGQVHVAAELVGAVIEAVIELPTHSP